MRKSRTPAGFVSKPLRNGSQKNAETLLLELKTKKKVRKKVRNPLLESLRHRLEIKPRVRQRRIRMRKSRTPAGFVPKPLRNYSLKNPEMLLLEPTKNKEKHPKSSTSIAPDIVSQRNSAQAMRNRSQKNAGKPLRNVRLESPQATRQNP